MKVLIVSGFLGAGKTTFIQTLSHKTGLDFAVMENEYGEEGIDGSLLEQNRNRLKVWELTEGCICCSLKSDFALSVLTIANTANPEYLIIEPTGVGLLSSVINNIHKIEYERIRLLQPLTIVDINCIDSYIGTFGDFYLDQIKHAPRIFLSKIEQAAPQTIEYAVDTLKSINPGAAIIAKPYDAIEKRQWFELLDEACSAYSDTKVLPAGGIAAAPNLETVSINNIRIGTIEELMHKLSVLIEGRFGRVYRTKGFVPVNGRWAKFDIVNTQYRIETCAPMKSAKMTVIGTALEKKALHILFTEKDR